MHLDVGGRGGRGGGDGRRKKMKEEEEGSKRRRKEEAGRGTLKSTEEKQDRNPGHVDPRAADTGPS
ncbi:unnamed protein product [Pleuronectes platessa]|uniref:Uncharacterized protein n=1 Tax=Pleuronectes platessa TaxID=8262 RepID=A0A9N7YU05_PLEPL|nr:unnamed protein product [Pleuronectes platessa]